MVVNDALCQFLADILDVQVQRQDVETTAKGQRYWRPWATVNSQISKTLGACWTSLYCPDARGDPPAFVG